MDANRFDMMTRDLITVANRRRLLAALLGAMPGLLVPNLVEAGGRCKPKCGKCERCKRGRCRETQNGRRCKPGRCKPEPDGRSCGACRVCDQGACAAVADGTDCGQCRVCERGACVVLPDGNPCGTFKQCQDGRCRCRPPAQPCNEFCVLDCPDTAARNPITCACCQFDSGDCSLFNNCCSGVCVDLPTNPPRSVCSGLAPGDDCVFDAQCRSRSCQDGRCAA